MKLAIILSALLCFTVAAPVAATESDADHIGNITDAIDGEDLSTIPPVLDELYDVALDENLSPACRVFADVLLTGYTLIVMGEDYPESSGIENLFNAVLEVVPTARFDCEVAL